MPIEFAGLPLWAVIALFAGAALAIALAGTRLAGVADTLADRTGLGEVIAGALFVGASTSLPGLIASVTAALEARPGLAIGNALGGLVAQTTFIAIADLVYRRANLEHAAASLTALTQGTLLATLLTLPILAASGPELTFLGVHPASVVLVAGYGFGLRLLALVKDEPMWRPVRTAETRGEAGEQEGSDPRTTRRLWGEFLVYAAVTAAAGFVLAEASITVADRTGLSETAVGTYFTGVASSLPELVTAVAAVRRNALNLALGNILGGNAFDALFLAAADVAYREGSIYHAFTAENFFTAALTILMTGVLLLGMLRRERRGVVTIGFESALVLLLYLGSIAVFVVDGGR